MTTHILKIDASPRKSTSVSRQLTKDIVARFDAAGETTLRTRDLSAPLPFVTEDWTTAAFTPPEDRTDDQRAVLATSEELIGELQDADVVVIGLPIYNFGLPAALKAWIDQVARSGLTFRYTPDGPVGLLENKRAVIAVTSGGTEVGSAIDYATGHLRHVLGFLGITDVTVVKADRLMVDADAALTGAQNQIDALPTAA